MSIFKRVFGQGTPETDKQFEKEVEQIESGENSKIYPILKPGNWIGLQTGAIYKPLLGPKEEPNLVIAYGYSGEKNFIFLTESDMENRTVSLIHREAFANLEAEAVTIHDGDIITASCHDFSSEKILSEDFLDELHRRVNSPEIVVSIPRRTVLYAIAHNASPELVEKFCYLHNYTWNDDSYGNAQISNRLFIVKNGMIADTFFPGNIEEDTELEIHEPNPDMLLFNVAINVMFQQFPEAEGVFTGITRDDFAVILDNNGTYLIAEALYADEDEPTTILRNKKYMMGTKQYRDHKLWAISENDPDYAHIALDILQHKKKSQYFLVRYDDKAGSIAFMEYKIRSKASK